MDNAKSTTTTGKDDDDPINQSHDDTNDKFYTPHVQAQPKQRKLMLFKYTIYVTSQRMYIVGSNNRETMFRVLEIDLTQPDDEGLSIIEDNVFFTRNEIMKVLSGLEESSEGGLTKKLTLLGLLGFIRFTQNWYLSVITKRSVVSILGGHYLYHIDDTELIPVCNNYKKPDRNSEETRYLMTFANLDLTKTFYYSYTYDLTNSLQKNFMNNKKQSVGPHELINFDYNEMFVWNSFLFKPIFAASFDRIYDWFQPIIHGFIDQAKISVFDAKVYITIIARRSHHFAGARFLKRGVNDQGNVANEVETEQIVHDLLTSSFHDPAGGFYNNPRYTSYVQHRGSIPLSWSQETGYNIKLQAKPPITIDVVDPFYSAAALHFDDMLKRYGSPVLVLNLIKQHEKTPRESKLLNIFEECITYLNKFLQDKNKLNYTAWDMSRASKSRGQDVIEYLERYADETLKTTGFFHNGSNLKQTKLQQGVCRTNCIDCLDRTNAAQFIIGKRALGYQLQALGFIDDKYLEYDSDVVNILTEMFHDHGDTIALQYGGSHLVNTMETYRKINQWTSHSRDMIESIKRFYSNSFVDAQRQELINLFLGNYVWEKGLPMLWDLNTDYYLHHDFLGSNLKFKPSYTHWYTDSHLIDYNKAILKYLLKTNPEELSNNLILRKYQPYPNFYENYFIEMYVPRVYTSLQNAFEFTMNSTLRYVSDLGPVQSGSKHKENEDEFDLGNSLNFLTSPFEIRKPQLINSKLRAFESANDNKNSTPEKTSSQITFTEEDEFNVFKFQIAQLFENLEDEYIYYPLSLRKFLSNVMPKIMHDENLPVFDNSLNSNSALTQDGFYNFNLEQSQKPNENFTFLQDKNLNTVNERLNHYNEAASIPSVKLTDEITYYNTLNSVKSLPVQSEKSIRSNEYSFDYDGTTVALQDYDVYIDSYKLSNVGTTKEFELSKSQPIVNDHLNDNYFAASSEQDEQSLAVSPVSSQLQLFVPVTDEDEEGEKEEPLPVSGSVVSLEQDYIVNDVASVTNVENAFDQFPNIQDDNDEEHLIKDDAEEGHNTIGDEDDEDEVNDTVIHNEDHQDRLKFRNEEIDALV